jgi:hypothetical protein
MMLGTTVHAKESLTKNDPLKKYRTHALGARLGITAKILGAVGIVKIYRLLTQPRYICEARIPPPPTVWQINETKTYKLLKKGNGLTIPSNLMTTGKRIVRRIMAETK